MKRLIGAVLLLPAAAFGHVLWIEASPESLRLCFGEPPEEVGKLERMEGIEARLEDASGRVERLPLESRPDGFYAKPARAGWITAFQQESRVKESKRLGCAVLSRYHARAAAGIPQQAPAHRMELDILPAGKEGAVSVRVLFRGDPLKKSRLIVTAPNGWQKEVRTDADGEGSFTPLWEGLYVVSLEHVETVPGEHEGQPYDAVRHVATLSLRVDDAGP